MCTIQRPSLAEKTEKIFVYEEKKVGRIDSCKTIHILSQLASKMTKYSKIGLKNFCFADIVTGNSEITKSAAHDGK